MIGGIKMVYYFKLETVVVWKPEGSNNLQFEVETKRGDRPFRAHFDWLTDRIYSLQNELSEMIDLMDAVLDRKETGLTTNPNDVPPEAIEKEPTLSGLSIDEKIQMIAEKQAKNKEKIDKIKE